MAPLSATQGDEDEEGWADDECKLIEFNLCLVLRSDSSFPIFQRRFVLLNTVLHPPILLSYVASFLCPSCLR